MPETAPAAESPQSDWRAVGLRLWWSIDLVALTGVTWPLWTPLRDPPMVPAFRFLARVPPSFDFVLLAALAFGALAVVARRGERAPRRFAIIALLLLLANDQLRWQPWAYHLLVCGVVLRARCADTPLGLLRVLAISVYAYAAIAKLDYPFAATLGQQFLRATFAVVGLQADAAPRSLALAGALTLPLVELSLAVLLAFDRTRQAGVWIATLMHLTAVLALSPLGLNHRAGVLLWNLFFLAHVWLLFYRWRGPMLERVAFAPSLPAAIVLLAVIGPLTRPLGLWDRWPAWGLYAPGGEITEVYVHQGVASRLPGSLPIAEADEDAAWRRVELDEWMLGQAYAPLYPQRRTTLALALHLQQTTRLGDFIQVVLSSPADRFTGEREEETLLGVQAIEEYATRYWLSTQAVSSR